MQSHYRSLFLPSICLAPGTGVSYHQSYFAFNVEYLSEYANVNVIYCFICTLPLPTHTHTHKTQRLKPNFSEAFIERLITDKYKQSSENIAKHAKLIIIQKFLTRKTYLLIDYTEYLFYRVPKHSSFHEMSLRMQAPYARKLPCSGCR